MSKFKADIVVASNSKALLVQLYEEAKKLGWGEYEWYNNIFHPNNKPGVYVLKFSNDEVSFHNHPCNGITHNLPADWNSVLEDISEKNGIKTPFNIGDWVVKENSKDNTPYKVESIDKDGWCIGDTPGNGWSSRILRLATEDEIKQQLIKQARDKGFVDGITFLGCNGSDKDIPIKIGVDHQIKAITGSINEGVYCGNSWIFHKGKWATIIEDKPITYSVGNRFTKKNNFCNYVLVQVDPARVQLINIPEGNRVRDGIIVKDIFKITEEEFDEMCVSGDYKLIK